MSSVASSSPCGWLIVLAAGSGLLLAACDQAKDLVEQGKKQATEIQKSIEEKTKESGSTKATASDAAPAPSPSSLPAAPPVPASPAAASPTLPPATAPAP